MNINPHAGELCYRLWLIYDKKQLEKNNLKCGILSEEVNINALVTNMIKTQF